MQTTEHLSHDQVLADRARYVSAGVATPRLVVAAAEGARVTDVDGRVFVDFAGGIGCQNTGHRFAPVVDAIHRQADLYLHQCFMVGVYEPYVETCRLLAELSPCTGPEQKSILVNSGAEANENAVKIARAATGRPAVVVFDNAFHGRTLLTMTMTSKVHPYKAGFGPFAPEVYRAPAPYPYRGVTSDDAIAGLKKLFKAEVDPQTVACVLGQPCRRPADARATLGEKGLGEQQDVARPLAERGQRQLEHTQPVIEVFAQLAVGDGCARIAVRRRDDADVRLDRFRTTQPLKLSFLQHPQELRLDRRRHLPDLVEKQYAAAGLFDFPGARRDRAREGSALHAEQL